MILYFPLFCTVLLLVTIQHIMFLSLQGNQTKLTNKLSTELLSLNRAIM